VRALSLVAALVCALCLSSILIGCVGLAEFRAGAAVANGASAEGWAAAPVLERECMAPMRKAAREKNRAEADRLRAKCRPVLVEHEALRVAREELGLALENGGAIGALMVRCSEAIARFGKLFLPIELDAEREP
jgi:hypothetical protein